MYVQIIVINQSISLCYNTQYVKINIKQLSHYAMLKYTVHSRKHNIQATRRQITARIELPIVIQASSMKDAQRCAHETSADKQWTAHIVYIGCAGYGWIVLIIVSLSYRQNYVTNANKRQFFSHDVELNNKGILHFTFFYTATPPTQRVAHSTQ